MSNQLWIADLGLPGPAAGKGDKVVFLPPGYKDKPRAGYRAAYSPSSTMLVGIRSLPVGGDVPGAIARMKTVKLHPLKPTPGWTDLQWLDLTPAPQDTTPLAWENNFQFWQQLYEVINTEVPNPRAPVRSHADVCTICSCSHVRSACKYSSFRGQSTYSVMSTGAGTVTLEAWNRILPTSLPGEIQLTIRLKKVSLGTELNIVHSPISSIGSMPRSQDGRLGCACSIPIRRFADRGPKERAD